MSVLTTYLLKQKELVDNYMTGMVERLDSPEELKRAMSYSIHAGGKRLRPVLLLATMKAFGKEETEALSVAAAIEMIHTYSLIHDDLPAMDDDDLRRGKPTNHKVFGEAMAILAGDALLTESFRLMATDSAISSDKKVKLIAELARAAGPEGMVGGQVADMMGENQELTIEDLEYIHLHKTGKLLAYSIKAGAILADALPDSVTALEDFAYNLGLAFQIKDDILDVEGDEELLGKPVGSDETNSKSTYPQILTLEGAKEKCNKHLNQAKTSLHRAAINHEMLELLSDYIVNRDH